MKSKNMEKINPELEGFRVKLGDIEQDPNNARAHDERNIEAIKQSLKTFGQQKPIVVSSTGHAVAGNGTLAAAKLLGWKEIAAITFDSESKAHEAGYAIADNRTAELATWDEEILATTVGELPSDLRIGWDDLEVNAFRDALELGDVHGEDENEKELSLSTSLGGGAAPDIINEELDEIENIKPKTMKPGDVEKIGLATLVCGDCVKELSKMEDNSVDSIVCDPPYGIGFMNSAWDCDVPGDKWATECLRVIKPGGHLIAFGATRTIHRLATSVEDAGFEIRDLVSWLQWQGFPKSMAVESMPGWGTALKPSQEPAVMARKPLDGTVAENVIKWGVGGLNIDGCRLENGDPAWPVGSDCLPTVKTGNGNPFDAVGPFESVSNDQGRWPANIYACPKPPRREKEDGCEDLDSQVPPAVKHQMETKPNQSEKGITHPRAGAGRTASTVKNFHPTVKPVRLIRWLVRLVTPPGGVVLDTFVGSGTTNVAAIAENIKSIGIERDPSFAGIAKARITKAHRLSSDL